ncbi:hypothetical protein Trydic_g12627 [Trypoxylus dichotomus]
MSFKNLTDFYINDDIDLSKYNCEPQVIAKKGFLKFIRGVCPIDDEYVPPISQDWYPRCNSYYPYTEDVDAINRVDHLLAAKKFLESFTTIKKDERNNFDAYGEIESQTRYLQSSPAVFLILGKPGIGEQQLGKLLSEYWKCVYVDPETLIEEEIRSGTRAGQCIEFNLRCGRAISIDVILRLLEKRVKSKSVQHRGFVVCGFPLIHNDMYQEDPVSSESAIFTAQEIFEEILEPVGKPSLIIRNVSKTSQITREEEEEETEDERNEQEDTGQDDIDQVNRDGPFPGKPAHSSLDVGSAASQIFKATDITTNYAAQLNFIFSLCHEPLVIIYIMCQNYDVVTKHENCRYNLEKNEIVNLIKDQSESVVYTIYTKAPGFENEDLPDNLYDVPNYVSGLSSSDLMYLTYLPCNFSGNVQAQLEQYRFEALPTIEKHVLLHDPQYFIKVDGRLPPLKMFNIIKFKLRMLPLPMVFIPEKLVEPIIPIGAEGDIEDTLIDYETKTPEACFNKLRRKKIVHRMFKLRWSRWGSICPVSMKQGTYVTGKPTLAVKFLNHVYFLSDELSLMKFMRNPRPYLLPPYPRPSCKIMIIGPNSSGKSVVAKCLALLLNGQVLEAISLQSEYMKRVEKERLEKIRTDAINEAIQILSENNKKAYEAAENARIQNKQKWIARCKDVIGEMLLLVRALLSDDSTVISSFPQRRSIGQLPIDTHVLKKLEHGMSRLRNEFIELGLPYDNMQLCEKLNADPSGLEEFMPAEIKTPIPFPDPVSIFDEFVTKYADDKVAHSGEAVSDMSIEDIGDMYVNAIREVEDRNIEAGEHHGGWVLAGAPPVPEILELIFEKCKPDDIFVLRDPECSFLLERYKVFGRNEFQNFREFFEKMDKPSIAMISPSITSTCSYKVRLARGLLDEVLENKFGDVSEEINEASLEEVEPEIEAKEVGFIDEDYFASHATRLELKRYEEGLHAFERKCEQLYDYLEDIGIDYKEITVTDKTLEELMKEVVTEVDNRYQYLAHEFTPDERIEEVEDFGEAEIAGEGLEEEMEEKLPDPGGNFMQNRRLGDTNIYCPVTYRDHWVLWRGKEEYGAVYDGKLYFMASKRMLDKFLTLPRDYIFKKPVETFPPPRICVVGVAGSGKTTLAKALSLSLGLHYVSYENYLKRALNAEHREGTLDIILNETDNSDAQTILAYLQAGEPLPDELLTKINLKEIWCDEPKHSVGFVLDGFPKRPSDLKYIEENGAVPDVVLELSTANLNVNQRYAQKLLNEWRELTERAQEEQDAVNRQFVAEWEETRQNRIDELMEAKRQARYQEKIQEKHDKEGTLETVREEDEGDVTDRSQISYNSVAEAADLEEVRAIVDQEYPEPVFEDNWETLDEARERIIRQTETNFVTDIEYLKILKETFDNELIEWVEIDASSSISMVFDQAMRAVDKYKFRSRSLFERCYDINLEMAESLLRDGYYFLSRFGKVCPVQTYEKSNSVLMYYPLEQKMDLHPIIHRNYIYFLAGKRSRDKFCNDPLFYTMRSDVNFPLIPFRVAVIGPPKSGKTSLADRFKRELGLKVISIGQAARYVLRSLPFSKLAKEMEFVLRNGWELTSEMTMRCVEAMTFDGRALTQGVVFDGFPNSRHDVDHLAEVGLIPHLIIYLDANINEIRTFLSTDKVKRGVPVFSQKFINHRCDEWFNTADNICHWLDKEYQILFKMRVKPSKWGVWTAAYELASAVMFEIKYYFKNCNRDMALHLGNMQITSAEFNKRRSCYKHYCPCCLLYNNVLVNGGDPPDRTGLIQFRNNYYWLCPQHTEEFANDPEIYLPPYNDKMLPGDLPLQVILEERPSNCYENGICIVCYWDSQYEKSFKDGYIQYACSYKEKIYLFDTKECMSRFINRPHKYFSKAVRFKTARTYSSLKMEDLPVLGMLEQYIVRNVIKAVTNTSITRPVLPGLDIQKSAAINMALHLKIHNTNTPKEFLPLYERAFELFNERRIEFINSLARMKRTLNPSLHYEEPLERLVIPQSGTPSSEKEECFAEESVVTLEETSRVPVPDERFDYLCDYFKPLSKVPAFLNVVDIAGLVKGASEGQGLGNAFLSHISACDAIFHLCRAFEDDDVTHVEGEVNPIRDLEIIGEELRLKDEEMLMKNMEKLERTVLRGGDKKMKPEYDVLVKVKGVLVDQKQHIRFADWHTNDVDVLNKYLFLTSKPMIYLVNLAEKDYIKKKNKCGLDLGVISLFIIRDSKSPVLSSQET